MQSELVERQSQIAHAVAFRLRQRATAQIDLERRKDEGGQTECRIARLAQFDECGFTDIFAHVDVGTFLLTYRGLAGHGTAAGAIVVADEYARRVWQR